MLFTTPYKTERFKTPPEENSGVTIVERTGYEPAKVKIENMIHAGQRLSDYRKMQYDFTDGQIDENFSDPTRSPNFDLADATQLQLQTEANLLASQAVQEPLESPLADNPEQNPVP